MTTHEAEAWLEPGRFSHPGSGSPLLAEIVEGVGKEPRDLARAVQGLMVHIYWREAYGLPQDRERASEEANIRGLEEKLGCLKKSLEDRLRMESPSSPGAGLPPDRRLNGTCRDFSLLYAALLRAAGIPARCRCGFGMYFQPGHGEDHWVVERWTGSAWAISDAQLDTLQATKLRVAFDPLELPDGAFLSGAEAWLACRAGANPKDFGIFDFSGWDFVLGNLVRDIASLAGTELLPWDLWGVMLQGHQNLGGTELESLDEAARLASMRTTRTRDELQALAALPPFAVGRHIKTWQGESALEVDLGD